MAKIIFSLVIVFGALLVLRLLNVSKSSSRDAARSGRAPRQRGRDAAMVRCVGCGVFLPRAESIETPRGPTCGDAGCQRLGRRGAA